MIETLQEEVSLSGAVIEDLTYEPLDPGAFRAELLGIRRTPLYKRGGFFVFTNIRTGSYVLRLTAERFQARELPVGVPVPAVAVDSPPALDTTRAFAIAGEDELIVVVQGVNPGTGRVTFAAEVLPRGIPAGSAARALAFSARLAEALEPGLVASARLDSVAGLVAGDVLRIVRGRSIRMRYDPYDPAPAALTRLAGRVVLADDPSLGLPGAQVRLTHVDGVAVAVADVEGAPVALIPAGISTVVLGTERDVATTANHAGDYNLYTAKADAWSTVTLAASLAGFLPQAVAVPVLPRRRNRIDFVLARA